MFSFPDGFLLKMKSLAGFNADEFTAQYESPPCKGLRLNRLKTDTMQFEKAVDFLKGRAPFCGEGYYVGGEGLGKHPWHHAGAFYLQEPSAMSAVTALSPKPGMKVLDLCAAPGGKSTQIASALMGEGLLVSNEIVPSRAKILLSNIERMGVQNAVVTNEKPEVICSRLSGFFDCVLVDAPCSGEGMFRRDPVAVHEWRPELPPACAKRQLAILESAKQAVGEDGVLAYSTCTFSPEENEGVIDAFLKLNPDFEIEETGEQFGRPACPEWAGASPQIAAARRIFPQDGGEGHFVARLRRRSPNPSRVKQFDFKQDPESIKIFIDFYESCFKRKMTKRVFVMQDSVFILPDEMPEIKGIHVIRAGILAGRIKKGRFEPEHALYLASKREDHKNFADFPLNSPELAAYLHGETIEAPADAKKGYIAVLAQGIPVGFGKCSEGVIKNHYPKGLRNL